MKFFGRSIEQNADRSAMGYESPLKNAGAGSVPDNGETIVFIFTGDDIEFTATAESITVDWGDGPEEEFHNLDRTVVEYTCADEAAHTVRIRAKNLSLFICSSQ